MAYLMLNGLVLSRVLVLKMMARFLFPELNIGAQQWHLPNLMFWVPEFLASFPYAHSVHFALKLNVEKSSVDNAYLTNPNYMFPTQLQD